MVECSGPPRRAPSSLNRCGFHKYLGMVCNGSIQIIRHESDGYGGRFCSNRKSVRHNGTNFSVRIGQASFTEPNRIGQVGLFPNGAERSGPQKAQKGAERRNAERRRTQKRRKAQKGTFQGDLTRFEPISSGLVNWWLTGSSGFHSSVNNL